MAHRKIVTCTFVAMLLLVACGTSDQDARLSSPSEAVVELQHGPQTPRTGFGGSQQPSTPHPDARQYDFFGVIQTFDLEGWERSIDGFTTGGPESDEVVIGGPESDELVGPARFVLTDGTEVTVPPGTPGASSCDPLLQINDPTVPDECVIIGKFQGAAPKAAWFGLLHTSGELESAQVEEVLVSGLAAIRNESGVVTAFGEHFLFPLAPTVAFDCLDAPQNPVSADHVSLPEAAVHFAEIDLETNEIVGIHCGYNA